MVSTSGPQTATRSKYHNGSYAVLDAARADARQKRDYNSEATRTRMTEECIKHTQLEPYPEQLDLAECMLLGVDAVSIAGTGWGKTLPFVLPLLVPEAKNKMMIVLSPLNALEDNQAKRFEKMGLPSVALNGESNSADILADIERGTYRVVILGPKLLTGGVGRVRALFSKPRFSRKVLGVVVDEAHCITQWGTDFRPEYGDLGSIRALLSLTAAIHATSATMTPLVLSQVCETLLVNLNKSFVLHLGNDRPNITWEVVYMTAGKSDLETLGHLLLARLPSNGDLNTLTRLPKTMVFFDDILQSMRARRWLVARLPAALQRRIKSYNSRRSTLAKKLVMHDFQRGDVDMLFATEAAGMGCDIPDVEHVVQFMAPESLSIWMQRAGRAGRRPNMQARATLLVQPSVFQEMGKKARREGEPIVYKKEVESGLRRWIEAPEDRCRRDIADEYFDNPPRRSVPTGECCDACTRRELARRPPQSPPAAIQPLPLAGAHRMDEDRDSVNHFSPENWRAFLPATRSNTDIETAKKILAKWRYMCWNTHYSHQPFGSTALLPEPMFSALATRTSIRTVAELHDLKWRLADRHGAEVLALLEPIDRRAGLEKLHEEAQKHQESVAAKAAKAEEKRARDEQREYEKRERDIERELERLRKVAEAAQKKQATEEKKRAKAEEHMRAAARRRYEAGVRAAKRAVLWIVKAQNAGEIVRPRKRKRKAESEDLQTNKKVCIDKENMAPTREPGGNAGGGSAASGGETVPNCAPTRPQPRPRPFRRPVTATVLPSPPSTPFTNQSTPQGIPRLPQLVLHSSSTVALPTLFSRSSWSYPPSPASPILHGAPLYPQHVVTSAPTSTLRQLGVEQLAQAFASDPGSPSSLTVSISLLNHVSF